ncbi:MAG: magnesium transporter [Anaerolinea sp.]|nr:magnesium transporter [Anaerolinea sp.]
MATAEIESWLSAAVTAARSGARQQAVDLLLQVVAADEQNEQAWSWLAELVESDADRRICLENVLTINPDNELAQQMLLALTQPSPAPSDSDEIVVRREYASHSLASAILYPEQQVKEWRYRDATTIQQAPAVTIAAKSAYDDIWTRGDDMCAYCAQSLDAAMTTCPNCHRTVWTRQYRYPDPSVNMHILWVLLVGSGQLFLIQGLYNLVVTRTLIGSVAAGFMMLLFLGLALGVYWRQSWAHLGAIIASGLVLVAALIDALLPVDLSSLDTLLLSIDPAIARFLGSMVNTIGDFIRTFQLAAVALTLFYAVFQAAADFQQIDVQQVAQLKKRLQFASDYHTVAKEFARQGMMATAVLHWQRAVGKEPHHPVYLRALGVAYAQLGFYERSLDILQSGQQLSTHPDKKADFEQLIARIQRKQAVEGRQDEQGA